MDQLVFHNVASLAHRSVGNKIREFRKSQGLTQEQLANKAGLSQSAICRLERSPGDSPLRHFVLVSKALDIGVSDLTKAGTTWQVDEGYKLSIKPSFAKKAARLYSNLCRPGSSQS